MQQEQNELWRQWEEGVAYQQAMGFDRDFPMFERFKQGDQWPPATARTRNLPRPVFNIVEMNVRHKRAAVLNGPIALAYAPADTPRNRLEAGAAALGADAYTDLAARLWKSAGQDELNARAVDDAATLGTGIWHYYWDASADGPGREPGRGNIRGETLDPLCLVLADPGQADIQRQAYVLVARRAPLAQVRDMARREGLGEEALECLSADQSGPEGAYARERAGGKYCTLLTRYSRDGQGRVVFSQGTRSCLLVKERPLTPSGSPGEVRLYPIVTLNWRRRKGSAFGIGEAQELLPNQKAVNFNIAMLLLSVQQTAWPKLLTKPGALQQPVTNEPGEHIIDYYAAGGDGIKFMQPPAFSAMAAVLADKVVDLTRRVSDMSEVSTGEPLGGNLAASAILALQNQARTPIEEIQRRYWNAVERIGELWLELFGAYYGAVARPGEDGLVHPGDYCRFAYDLTVNVGPASEYSRVLAQSTLDKMLDRGDITIDEYMELSDPNIAPFKEQFRRMRRQGGTAEREAANDLPPL